MKYFAAVVLLAAAAAAATVPANYVYPAQPAAGVYPGVQVKAYSPATAVSSAYLNRQYAGVVQPAYSPVAYSGQLAYPQPAVAYAGQPTYVQSPVYPQPAYVAQAVHV